MDALPSWIQDIGWLTLTYLALLIALISFRKFITFVQPRLVNKSVKRVDIGRSASPITSNRVFHLLDLPGEIRNLIYEFAVTERHGLRYVENRESKGVLLVINSGTAGALDNPRIANPLRWVCHQLRQETRRLEVLCNDIHFKTTERVNNLDLFAKFLSLCPTQLHQQLRTIILDPDLSVEQATCQMALSGRTAASYTLMGFCLQNTTVTVKWRWESMTQEHCFFIPDAVFVSTTQRHNLNFTRKVVNGNTRLEDFFLRALRHNVAHINEQRFWKEPGLPDNLRIYPAEAVFDEVAFRTLLTDSPDVGRLLEMFDVDVDYWVLIAREIYANGL